MKFDASRLRPAYRLYAGRMRILQRRDVFAPAGWMGASHAIRMLVGFATVPVTVRILGLDGYGIQSAALAACALVHGLALFGSSEMLMTYATRSVFSGDAAVAGAILRFALLTSLAISLLAYGVIVGLTFFTRDVLGVGDPYAGVVLLLGVVGVVACPQSICATVLRMAGRMHLYAGAVFLESAARFGLLVLVWRLDGDIFDVALVSIATAVIGTLGLATAAAGNVRQAGFVSFWKSAGVKVPRDAFRFQMVTWGRKALNTVSDTMDVLLLAYIVDAYDVGIYAVAKSLLMWIFSIFVIAGDSLYVVYSRCWFSDRLVELRHLAFASTLVATLSASVVYGLLYLFREPLVLLVYGPDFARVVDVLELLILPGAAVAVCCALTVIPDATGRVWAVLLARALAGATGLALLAFLTLTGYGLDGAALARGAYWLVGLAVLAPFIYSRLRPPVRRPGRMEAP